MDNSRHQLRMHLLKTCNVIRDRYRHRQIVGHAAPLNCALFIVFMNLFLKRNMTPNVSALKDAFLKVSGILL